MANTSKGLEELSLAAPSPPVRTLPLRIIRQPLSKPWRKPGPPPPRVFSVHPRDFRQLVQSLTGAEPMAEASPVMPTSPPEVSSPTLPLQPDSPALNPRPAITANATEDDNGGPEKDPGAAGGEGAAFLWDSTLPANSEWSASPIWSPQLIDSGGDLFP